MLVGAGGNAGGQSTVLVVRRLALAGKRNSLSFHRIVGSEILVGAKLAIVLFAAAFLRCAIFKAIRLQGSVQNTVNEMLSTCSKVFGAECIAICLSMRLGYFLDTGMRKKTSPHAVAEVRHRFYLHSAWSGSAVVSEPPGVRSCACWCDHPSATSPHDQVSILELLHWPTATCLAQGDGCQRSCAYVCPSAARVSQERSRIVSGR